MLSSSSELDKALWTRPDPVPVVPGAAGSSPAGRSCAAAACGPPALRDSPRPSPGAAGLPAALHPLPALLRPPQHGRSAGRSSCRTLWALWVDWVTGRVGKQAGSRREAQQAQQPWYLRTRRRSSALGTLGIYGSGGQSSQRSWFRLNKNILLLSNNNNNKSINVVKHNRTSRFWSGPGQNPSSSARRSHTSSFHLTFQDVNPGRFLTVCWTGPPPEPHSSSGWVRFDSSMGPSTEGQHLHAQTGPRFNRFSSRSCAVLRTLPLTPSSW